MISKEEILILQSEKEVFLNTPDASQSTQKMMLIKIYSREILNFQAKNGTWWN